MTTLRALRRLLNSRALTMLSDVARFLYMVLAIKYRSQKGLAYPKVETLAVDIGYGETKTREALAELRRVGWLEVIAHGGGRTRRGTLYRVHVPDWIDGLEREQRERNSAGRGGRVENGTQPLSGGTQPESARNSAAFSPNSAGRGGGREQKEQRGNIPPPPEQNGVAAAEVFAPAEQRSDRAQIVELLTRAGVLTADKIADLPHVTVELVEWAIWKHKADGFTEPGRLANWVSNPAILKQRETILAEEARIAESKQRLASNLAEKHKAEEEQTREEAAAARQAAKHKAEAEATRKLTDQLLDAAFDVLPQTQRGAIEAEATRRCPVAGFAPGIQLHRRKLVRDHLLAAWDALAPDERELIEATFPSDEARHELAILKGVCERWTRPE